MGIGFIIIALALIAIIFISRLIFSKQWNALQSTAAKPFVLAAGAAMTAYMAIVLFKRPAMIIPKTISIFLILYFIVTSVRRFASLKKKPVQDNAPSRPNE